MEVPLYIVNNIRYFIMSPSLCYIISLDNISDKLLDSVAVLQNSDTTIEYELLKFINKNEHLYEKLIYNFPKNKWVNRITGLSAEPVRENILLPAERAILFYT